MLGDSWESLSGGADVVSAEARWEAVMGPFDPLTAIGAAIDYAYHGSREAGDESDAGLDADVRMEADLAEACGN